MDKVLCSGLSDWWEPEGVLKAAGKSRVSTVQTRPGRPDSAISALRTTGQNLAEVQSLITVKN